MIDWKDIDYLRQLMTAEGGQRKDIEKEKQE